MKNHAFHRSRAEMLPERPAPITTTGVIGWLRANLFSSYLSAGLTLASIAVLAMIIPGLIEWAFIDATLTGEVGKDCPSEGACWAWLDQRITQFFYGFYPPDAYWRVNVCIALLVPALAYMSVRQAAVFALRALVLACLSRDRRDPAGRRSRPRSRPDRSVRRLHAQSYRRPRRHRALAAHRHPAGAGPALTHADRPDVLRRVHRVHPRRAADHAALRRDNFAAALPAAPGHPRSADSRDDHHHGVCLRLHGRGDPRRAAGHPARAVRGRSGDGSRLLAVDAPDHPAAGAQGSRFPASSTPSSGSSRTPRWSSSSACSTSWARRACSRPIRTGWARSITRPSCWRRCSSS